MADELDKLEQYVKDFIVPDIVAQLNAPSPFTIYRAPEDRAKMEARIRQEDEALWRATGLSREEAYDIGDAYWYGKYGAEDD